MRENMHTKSLEMFNTMKKLKDQVFYTFNHSASNPIVGKIVEISDEFEKFRMYITSGTSYDGYKDVTLNELQDWCTSVEELIETADEAREAYYEEHKDMLKDTINKNEFCEADRRVFMSKIATREDRAIRATSK